MSEKGPPFSSAVAEGALELEGDCPENPNFSPLHGAYASSAVARVPFEIWNSILSLAADYINDMLCPWMEHERLEGFMTPSPSINRAVTRISLRDIVKTREALSRVCRAWHPIGIELLYKTLAIFTERQLTALVQRLKHSHCTVQPGCGWWTRELLLVLDYFRADFPSFPESVVDVLVCCPNLRVYVSTVKFGYEDESIALALQGRSLQHLQWASRVPSVFSWVSLVTSLHSLQSMSFDDSMCISAPLAPQSLTLPSLVHLAMRWRSRVYHGQSDHSFIRIMANWHLPCLRSLSIDDTGQTKPEIALFLAKHGQNLDRLVWSADPRAVIPAGLRLSELVLLHPQQQSLELTHTPLHLKRLALATGFRMACLGTPTGYRRLDQVFESVVAADLKGLQRIQLLDVGEEVVGRWRGRGAEDKTAFWEKWIAEWSDRGVRLENRDGRQFRLTHSRGGVTKTRRSAE